MLKYGDIVSWTYRHSLGRVYTTITKTGVFRGRVKHTSRWHGLQMAYVRFEGNKRDSIIAVSQLVREAHQ
jgi:hypothetical protein